MTWPLKGESAGERRFFWIVAVAFVLYFGIHFGVALYRGQFTQPRWIEKQTDSRGVNP